MADAHKNFAYSTVATAPSPANSGNTITVATGEGAKFPTPPFNATVWPSGALSLSTNAEIVRVTAVATDTLTISRTQESTSARSIVAGDQIAATITAKTLTDVEVGGSSGQLQYNNGGVFGGAAGLIYDATNTRLGVGAATPAETLDVKGNFQVRDADTATKEYRFRTSGSNLDIEGSGADVFLSVWSGANYTGTQRNKLRLESGADITHAIGDWQFTSGPFAGAAADINGTTGVITASNFVGSNITATNGNGTLLNPGTSQIAVTVPTGQQLSLIYLDIRNNQTVTAASNFYGMFIRTEGDGVDTGAAISLENNGKADALYIGVKGKAGAVTTNTPSGIGLDLNHAAGGGENSSTFGGTGYHAWDFSTTDNGDAGATLFKMSKEGNLNTNHRMLYMRANRRFIDMYTPEGTGYVGTNSAIKMYNDTGTKFNLLANGYIGIGKDPTVQLDITDAGEVGVVIANSATSDTRAKLSLTGNATNGRGHVVISGKHSGFDGTQNGDGPSILEMIGDNSATNPTRFAMTVAASTKMLKWDVVNDGAGGSVTGAMKLLVNGNFQLAKSLVLGAGTTTVAPISFASGTNLTTAAAGAMEYDGSVFYATPAASTRNLNTIEQFVMLNANYTLTSQTAAQKAFNATTNGAVTLPIGTYTFEAMIRLSSMSATSGSFGFALGGTATFTQAWTAVAALSAATVNAQISYNTAANTSLTTAGTAASGQALIKGEIRVTGAGTVIPQVSLTIAAAAVVNAGSYFRITPMGSSTVASVGNWS